MKLIKNLLPLLFVLFLSVFSVLPFFHAGFFPIHDNTQVQRVFEMTKSLKDGMFPVRWVSDLGFGYGYPIFNFYAPFAYYLGSIINLLGFEALLATKLMMVLGIIFAGVSMYFFAKEVWGKAGGILSALLYVFLPYHAVDVFVRGDVAEFWAYAFIPLAFYGLLAVHKTGKFRFVLIGSLAYAALILSHNLTAFMATPFILVFAILLFFGNKKSGKNLLLTLILGVLIAAFYWLPALMEINYTNVLSQIGGGADYKDHFVCLNQFWSSPWGFGGSVKGCVDGLSFMIGKLHILLGLISIIIFGIAWRIKKINFQKSVVLISFFVFLILSIFLSLNYSKPIWDLVTPMAILQYPWRFLLMVGFSISFIAGSIFYVLQNILKNKWISLSLLLILSIVIVGFSSKYFVAQKYLPVSANNFTSDYSLKFTTSQTSSEYMPKDFIKPKAYSQIPADVRVVKSKMTIISQLKKTELYQIRYSSASVTTAIIPIAYFPAWKVSLDSHSYSYQVVNNGLLVNLPTGEHLLSFDFRQTMIETLANLLSLAGGLMLIIGIILNKKDL